ncbi:hypothetical protein ACFWGI_37955 [Streptomyces niveus]|uniref:hypothetical protein n=1 Tax=Streptomyces niveus TaxID=193462 RepID=UPI00366316F9
MSHTFTPTAQPLFTTREDLDHELTATGSWKALHAAVHASTPRLTSYPQHHGSEVVCGLRLTEDTPHAWQARTRGTVTITPDGTFTVRAYSVPGHRWLTALQHLGTLDPHALRPCPSTPTTADPGAPAWSLRPHVRNRSITGHLQPVGHVQARMLSDLPDTIGDVKAMLTVTPDNRTVCAASWRLAVGFLHTLTTGAPARPQAETT